MEKQQDNNQKGENLKILKGIQNNLSALKSSIAALYNQQVKQCCKIKNILGESQEIILKKISRSTHHNRKQWVSVFRTSPNLHLVQKIRALRDSPAKSESKSRITSVIKKESQINELKRSIERQKLHQQKVFKNRKIKQEQKESKRRIQQFFLLKQNKRYDRKYQIRKKRASDAKLIKEVEKKKQEQLKNGIKQKNELEQKMENNRMFLKRVQEVWKQIRRMDQKQFISILQPFDIKNRDRLSDEEIKKILMIIHNNKQERWAGNKPM